MQLPKISIVTPSLNQGHFLEQNLQSIHEQGYAAIEHVIMDGGSTDGSLAVIERYRPRLAHVSCGPDEGQYAAIARGFEYTTGEVMSWLNSDDAYLPGTLGLVGRIFAAHPRIEWLTTSFPAAIDAHGVLIKCIHVWGFTRQAFLRGDNLPGRRRVSTAFIQQESTFWRRSLWERAGGVLETRFRYAGDFELWARFFRHARLFSVDVPLGCYRRHQAQKTYSLERYYEEADAIFEAAGGRAQRRPVQAVWLGVRRLIATAPMSWRASLLRLFRMEPAACVTYDWVGGSWVTQET